MNKQRAAQRAIANKDEREAKKILAWEVNDFDASSATRMAQAIKQAQKELSNLRTNTLSLINNAYDSMYVTKNAKSQMDKNVFALLERSDKAIVAVMNYIYSIQKRMEKSPIPEFGDINWK